MAMVRYSTSRRHALAQARRLIGCYPHSRPPDVLQYANALADVLEQYQIGVVEECCDPRSGIARVVSFLRPSPAWSSGAIAKLQPIGR